MCVQGSEPGVWHPDRTPQLMVAGAVAVIVSGEPKVWAPAVTLGGFGASLIPSPVLVFSICTRGLLAPPHLPHEMVAQRRSEGCWASFQRAPLGNGECQGGAPGCLHPREEPCHSLFFVPFFATPVLAARCVRGLALDTRLQPEPRWGWPLHLPCSVALELSRLPHSEQRGQER